jgi:hypothetical protein
MPWEDVYVLQPHTVTTPMPGCLMFLYSDKVGEAFCCETVLSSPGSLELASAQAPDHG